MARRPDAAGRIERDGVAIHWERFGDRAPTIMLLPTWSLVPSRHWKFQVPYLARRHRVVTFDGRGTGRSDRPGGVAPYAEAEFAADAAAVLDATHTDRAVLVGWSCGARWGTRLAADHPTRVLGLVAIGPAVPLAPLLPEREVYAFDEPCPASAGWAKYNSFYWQREYGDFLKFFAAQMVSEAHSTKQVEDVVEWGLQIDAATLADTHRALDAGDRECFRAMCERVRCPVLVIHGDDDALRPHAHGSALAEATGGKLVTIAGGGHAPLLRDPVVVNRLIERFVTTLSPAPPLANAGVYR
jgi:pimeloyl-ACP methyl ester carboxylesterase